MNDLILKFYRQQLYIYDAVNSSCINTVCNVHSCVSYTVHAIATRLTHTVAQSSSYKSHACIPGWGRTTLKLGCL